MIADLRGNNGAARVLDGPDFQRLADLLAERYPLTLIDPAPSGLTRVLTAADQLVLVAPASPEVATSLANTQQWLGAHGHGDLVSRAVMVVNGVSRRTMPDASGPSRWPGAAAGPSSGCPGMTCCPRAPARPRPRPFRRRCTRRPGWPTRPWPASWWRVCPRT